MLDFSLFYRSSLESIYRETFLSLSPATWYPTEHELIHEYSSAYYIIYSVDSCCYYYWHLSASESIIGIIYTYMYIYYLAILCWLFSLPTYIYYLFIWGYYLVCLPIFIIYPLCVYYLMYLYLVFSHFVVIIQLIYIYFYLNRTYYFKF